MPLCSRASRKRMALTVLAAVWVMSPLAHPAGAAESYSEDAVKAAFLYRFTSYVDWPSQASTDPQFTIAVLDADGVAAELGRLLQNRQIQNRPAQVRSIKNLRELDGAQILYIGGSHRDDLHRLIGAVAGRPVLVVTNADGGLDAGSSVNFLLIDQRVRFEISLDAAQGSGLRVASELLAVAIRVRGRRVYTEAGCDAAGTATDLSAPCIREAARQ
jgi:YfiR/HmsC-like